MGQINCPYCNAIASVKPHKLDCKNCGAFAVHQGGGMFKWEERVEGMMGQIIKHYTW